MDRLDAIRGRWVAGYSDYYSVIARAISALPGKTEEARSAVYERARTALQERLRTLEPPISETDLSVEQFALEAAIQRVETESRSGDTRNGLSFISTVKQFVRSARDQLNNIALGGDSLKAVITAGLAQGLEFIQRTQLTSPRPTYLQHFRRTTVDHQIPANPNCSPPHSGRPGRDIRRDIRSLDYRDRPEVMAAEAPDLQSFK